MESHVVIRDAVLSDYSSIAKLDGFLNDEHKLNRKDIVKQSIQPISQDYFQKILSSSSKKIAVAVINGDIEGFALARKCCYNNHAAINNMSIIELEKIYVNPNHRGKGIGRKLFGEIVKFAQSLTVSKIELTVWGWNESALMFYERLGLYERYRKLELDIN